MPTASFRAESPVDDMDEDEFVWDMIEELQAHGINAQDITKLKASSLSSLFYS
ncbi:hypothetical protein FRC12_023332 [Ceratobasidium sp. 428]|nr:hypothetical protein FRC12_023332 [Ceratobasidium sp. 428]